MSNNIRRIEEISMNALPSLQTILDDGWVIRFANGYTKRANSVNPIYLSSGPVTQKIEKCERVFGERQQKTIFKLTQSVSPENLDEILEGRGYQALDHTSVRILELKNLSGINAAAIEINKELNDNWLEHYCRLNNVTVKDRLTLRSMLQNIIPEKYLVSLALEDKVIACGMGVIEDEYIGLFDIVVDADYRRQGYGEELVSGILQIGKDSGAKYAYLQVRQNNMPALRLYEKLGFEEKYQYWYRVSRV